MKLRYLVFVILATAVVCEAAPQQTLISNGPAVSMVVSVEARHGMNPAPVDRQDVMIYEG
jgi:hypothetical protein